MQNSDDTYGIYRRPTLTSLLTLGCAGAALFLGAWAISLQKYGEETLAAQRVEIASRDSEIGKKDRELLVMNNRLRDLQSDVYALKTRLETAENRRATANSAATDLTIALPAAGKNNEAAKTSPIEQSPIVSMATSVGERGGMNPPSSLQPETTASNRQVGSAESHNPSQVSNEAAKELFAADVLAGQILSYNSDYQRVYLSLGTANGGVEPGNRFSIWRGNEYVTDVEVVKVYSVTSTCRVLNSAPDGLQVGDIARRVRPVLGAL